MTDTQPADTDQTNFESTTERMLGQSVHAFSNMISGHFFSRTERVFGVNLPEWRVLRSVLFSPGMSQGEVATTEGLNVMNVSRAVAGLRKKGLLIVRPDPDDRRRTLLFATETAEDIGAEIGAREQLIYEHVFSVLSRTEMADLDELLRRVNAGLRDRDLPEPPAPTRDWAAELEAAAAEE